MLQTEENLDGDEEHTCHDEPWVAYPSAQSRDRTLDTKTPAGELNRNENLNKEKKKP